MRFFKIICVILNVIFTYVFIQITTLNNMRDNRQDWSSVYSTLRRSYPDCMKYRTNVNRRIWKSSTPSTFQWNAEMVHSIFNIFSSLMFTILLFQDDLLVDAVIKYRGKHWVKIAEHFGHNLQLFHVRNRYVGQIKHMIKLTDSDV